MEESIDDVSALIGELSEVAYRDGERAIRYRIELEAEALRVQDALVNLYREYRQDNPLTRTFTEFEVPWATALQAAINIRRLAILEHMDTIEYEVGSLLSQLDDFIDHLK